MQKLSENIASGGVTTGQYSPTYTTYILSIIKPTNISSNQ